MLEISQARVTANKFYTNSVKKNSFEMAGLFHTLYSLFEKARLLGEICDRRVKDIR